jgi:hypothetical protein
MTEEVTMQPEDEAEQEVQQEVQQEAQAQPVVAVDDPYASQAHLPDENRIWPPPFVKKHG